MSEPKEQARTEFNREMESRLLELSNLYQMADPLSDDDLLELQNKLVLYGRIYEIIGDLEAFAAGKSKMNYAYRKEVAAQTYMSKKQDRTGKRFTSTERDMIAELASKKYRRLEAEYEYESRRWANRREAVLEQINIMKRKHDGICNMWNRANSLNG